MVDQDLNMIIANNISALLTKQNKTQLDLAEYIGVTQTTVSYWCSGVKAPRMNKLDKICDFFNVPRSSLLENNSKKTASNIIKAVRIPVLGYVRAGIPLDAVEEILDYEEITPEMAASGDYFCLQVKGDSMEPKFSEGDVVVVKQQSDVESGDIAIVLVDGQDATIKKLVKYDDSHSIALVASNPLYPPMIFTEKEIAETPVTVIGKVVELRAKF